MLQNDYLLAKIGADTAENELFKVQFDIPLELSEDDEMGDAQRLDEEQALAVVFRAPFLRPPRILPFFGFRMKKNVNV